jgi:hypothetical protein
MNLNDSKEADNERNLINRRPATLLSFIQQLPTGVGDEGHGARQHQ